MDARQTKEERDMTQYQIENVRSGEFLGVYDGADEDGAIMAMYLDAGYTPEELEADEYGILNPQDLRATKIPPVRQWVTVEIKSDLYGDLLKPSLMDFGVADGGGLYRREPGGTWRKVPYHGEYHAKNLGALVRTICEMHDGATVEIDSSMGW
jgi:hypothetical protein